MFFGVIRCYDFGFWVDEFVFVLGFEELVLYVVVYLF